MNLVFFKWISNLSILMFLGCYQLLAQNCDLESSKNRREQVDSLERPLNYIIHLTTERRGKYNGTAFFIHPRVLLTAGHNLRKKKHLFSSRVKAITLRVGAVREDVSLASKTYKTKQNVNIYTLESFNRFYNVYEDFGLVLLPDNDLYKKAGGVFNLSISDSTILKGKKIYIAGYPSDKEFGTMWKDLTNNYFFYENKVGNPAKLEYLKYDFFTFKGMSGAPVWFEDNGIYKVFAIHTYGNDNDEMNCNTATLITKGLYDEILAFCMKNGININQ